MNTVNSLLEGASPYKVLAQQSAKLAGKWKRSGLLEGIESSTEKNNMAMLLENQAKQLVNEANNSTSTDASFTAGNSEAWAGVALPLVRRVFGEIVAKDLISVQPMNLPAGLIFYLDFQYGDNDPMSNPNSPGAVFRGRHKDGESLYGASSNMRLTSHSFNTGLYGAGEFGYSLNMVSSAQYTITAGAGNPTTGSATYLGLMGGDTEFSSSKAGNFGTALGAGNKVVSLVVTASQIGSDLDKEALRAITVTGSNGITVHPQFTRLVTNDASGVDMVEFMAELTAANTATELVQFFYPLGPGNLDDVGDFEDGKNNSATSTGGSNSTLEIPSIDVQLRSDTVAAKTRKLKAQWTPEFAQDLNAYHSIDAEAELTSILSEYISMEIDLEILDMLIQNADTVEAWSAKVATDMSVSSNHTVEGGQPVTISSDVNNMGVYYTKMSWFQTLGIKLQKVSNLIHQKTLRGGANWMVVSPKVSTILESIPGFAADSSGDSDKYNMGVQKMGAIDNRYTVYKNPYMVENIILMGYKGSQFLETGAVFAPYIPLIMTPLVYDPASFTPRKGIMTRYAKKMVRPDFYGKVWITDLDQV